MRDQSNKQKIYVIVGQTATGKSDYAVKLALRLRAGQAKKGAEIISADSRQVYKGLNIGSGKITKKEMAGIPHHLLDVANPKNKFTVVDFQKLVFKKIEEIITNGKTPIICGGTGFYINAVVNGTILPEVLPDEKLRAKLAKLPKEKLFIMLKKLDKKRAENIDKDNPVRLIRAIEIAKALGKVPKVSTRQDLVLKYEFVKIGLTCDQEKLKIKIHNRLLARMKKGMVKEVADLHKNGLSWKRLEELGLEYRYISLYLQKKLTKKEMLTQLESAINHYAKRQITWFKRDKEIRWVTLK